MIHLIIGPMFSGKSSELIRRIKRHTIAKRKCVVLKYIKDTRYSNKNTLSTHDLVQYNAIPCDKLEDVKKKVIKEEYDVIGIDEGQFFPDLIQFCETMANEYKKLVIVAGLDSTFERKPFENIIGLVPLSETVMKLNAVCVNCGQDASFSKRIGNETQLEVIGGADKYIAVCRSCYFL